LKIDLLRHKVSRAGKNIDLTPKEFDILALFARRKGEVLSRAMIADLVWGVNFDSDTNAVDVGVSRMRSKIDEPFPEKLIHTIRGVGYVLEQH
ncbi:MAG TPA: winged helix-turn-helix domain-containing protein, partial [Geobacteraceae bacterium]|nr:winged helix-turn-helix domain-containing protein [Geobacteraceae bacterium]